MIERHSCVDVGISVEAELATWGNDRVYFDPMWGNHGDQLIVMGSEVALAGSGVRRVDGVRGADRVVINGGGYVGGGGWLPYMTELVGRAEGLPVMVMPSTFEDPTEILSLMEQRRGPSTIYFREQVSYRLAKESATGPAIDLRLDDDMAFRLEGSTYLQGLHDRSRSDTLLIVERTDAESVSGQRAKAFGPARLKARIPEPLKLQVKRKLRQTSARLWGARKEFAASLLEFLKDRQPDYADLPVMAGDISRVDFCTFDEFGAYVADAAVVATTRLHVGILAALLGKETYLVPGTYHKMTAVYEHSLAGTAGIHLIDAEFLAS